MIYSQECRSCARNIMSSYNCAPNHILYFCSVQCIGQRFLANCAPLFVCVVLSLSSTTYEINNYCKYNGKKKANMLYRCAHNNTKHKISNIISLDITENAFFWIYVHKKNNNTTTSCIWPGCCWNMQFWPGPNSAEACGFCVAVVKGTATWRLKTES